MYRYVSRHVYKHVYRHVYRHVSRHVSRHVYRHVYRHVSRHVYRHVPTSYFRMSVYVPVHVSMHVFIHRFIPSRHRPYLRMRKDHDGHDVLSGNFTPGIQHHTMAIALRTTVRATMVMIMSYGGRYSNWRNNQARCRRSALRFRQWRDASGMASTSPRFPCIHIAGVKPHIYIAICIDMCTASILCIDICASIFV